MAVLQPLVSWYKQTNLDTDQVTNWDIGVVDASQVSIDFTFLIWNNRKGTSNVPDMQNAVIMTKDNLGGNTGELVLGQWIEVMVNAVDSQFYPIGWDLNANAAVSRPVNTTGGTTYSSTTSVPNSAPHTTTNGIISILGVANDGLVANSAGNFVQVSLHCRVPGNASAGLVNFRTRVTYQYV
jgi:hypothetical protein